MNCICWQLYVALCWQVEIYYPYFFVMWNELSVSSLSVVGAWVKVVCLGDVLVVLVLHEWCGNGCDTPLAHLTSLWLILFRECGRIVGDNDVFIFKYRLLIKYTWVSERERRDECSVVPLRVAAAGWRRAGIVICRCGEAGNGFIAITMSCLEASQVHMASRL